MESQESRTPVIEDFRIQREYRRNDPKKKGYFPLVLYETGGVCT